MKNVKKKLLFVITKGNFGGAQRYVFDLAHNLKKEYEITVASGEPGLLHTKLEAENIRILTIDALQRDINFAKNLASIWQMVHLLRDERPDIVHTNSSMAGFITSIAVHIYNIFYTDKNKKVKLIFTAHGWAFNENRSTFSRILFYTLHNITVLLSDNTISVSQKTKNDLSFFSFIKDKMTVVHNGSDASKLLSQKDARKKLSPDSTFNTWIGTLSELHKNKGLDITIEGLAPLLKENKNLGFFIAGSGEEEETLKTLSKRLGIEHQVIFLGFVEDAKKYLRAFNIFTLTSRTECFPYTLLEAGLSKLPVIATDVGGVSEIIENLYSGMLIRPNSPLDVTHALRYALEHNNELKSFGVHLYTHTKHNFSIKKMVSETKVLYEN